MRQTLRKASGSVNRSAKSLDPIVWALTYLIQLPKISA